jgi:hypothetical protein
MVRRSPSFFASWGISWPIPLLQMGGNLGLLSMRLAPGGGYLRPYVKKRKCKNRYNINKLLIKIKYK